MMTEYDPHHGHGQHDQPQPQQRSTILERGRAVKLMRNGDSFFPGRAFVINQRKYPMLDVFLDDASQALRANFGAVRCIYTPKTGTRLHDISELEDHRTYVASGGERFKKLHYLDIAEGKRVPNKERTPPKLPSIRRYDVEGRALRLSRSENVIIYVYRNGDPLTLPAKILLVKATLQNWESVLDEVTRKVSLPNSAVLKLYAMNGELVTSAQQLEYNGMYVAAGKERFKRIDYPDPKSFSPNSSPKMSRKSDHAGIKLRHRQSRVEDHSDCQPSSDTSHYVQHRYTKSDGTNTHTTTANSHVSVEHAGHRRPVREEYDFFNNKPQQHRRGPTKETDLDRDDGGIYKGRLNHRERVREIEDTRDTKVDLPVDYREAETIEEEHIYGNAGRTQSRRQPPPPSQPKTNLALANSLQRSPPIGSTPTRNINNVVDDHTNSRFSMNNDYQHDDDHHYEKNNGFHHDDYQPTPPPPPPPPPPRPAPPLPPPAQVHDEIHVDQHEEQIPQSPHLQQVVSPSPQSNKNYEDHAATVIQSHVRGYLTRKQIDNEKQNDTDQLTNNHDQQQQEEEVHKHEENQQQNTSQTNENSVIEPLADLTVQRAITEALVVDNKGEEEKMPHHDDDDTNV